MKRSYRSRHSGADHIAGEIGYERDPAKAHPDHGLAPVDRKARSPLTIGKVKIEKCVARIETLRNPWNLKSGHFVRAGLRVTLGVIDRMARTGSRAMVANTSLGFHDRLIPQKERCRHAIIPKREDGISRLDLKP